MKKTFISIMLFFALSALNAQVSLEHSYDFSGTLAEIEKNEFKYYVMDVPLAQCRIYNEDHTLFKTINLVVPQGYTLFDVKYVTTDLFNSDDQVELLYMYSKATLSGNETIYQYGLRVVDEVGTVLLNLNNGGFAVIQKGSDGAKLLAYQYIYFESYYLIYTNVYSLGGTVKSASAEAESGFNLYPNPASDMITVTMDPWEQIKKGQLIITDMSGRTMNTEAIEPGSKLTTVETGWMSPGTYVMSILSKEKIIASEKFEIK